MSMSRRVLAVGRNAYSRAMLPVLATAAASLPTIANAASGYNLPSSGASGILGSIETKLTEIANFVSQPLGVFVVICAFIFAAALWIFSPRSGALSVAFRAVAALVIVFNLTAIITYFTL